MQSRSSLGVSLALVTLCACAPRQTASPPRTRPAGTGDTVFFVHYQEVAVPLGCYRGSERRLAVGEDCLSLLPVGSSLFTEGVGSALSRPGRRECYEQEAIGLELGENAPHNGFSIWPPANVTKVKRLAASRMYSPGGPPYPPSIEESSLGRDVSVAPNDAALLTRAGIKEFGLPGPTELVVRQVVQIDLDRDGKTDRLFTIGFRSPSKPEPDQQEIRNGVEQLQDTYSLYLITARAPGQVQLLRRYVHTVLATVDLAGDGQVVLWLDASDSENLKYRLESFKDGRLSPLGCFGCGPGNGLKTYCSP